MKTLTYSIKINKPAHVVFEKITDNTVFPRWAKAWGDDMKCVGNWKEGESLCFTDASGSGTKAVVEEIKPNESIKMKHTAMVAEGNKEVAEMDDTMKKWVGTFEEYDFTTNSDSETTLKVVIVTDEVFEEMMGAWNQALEYFRVACEAD